MLQPKRTKFRKQQKGRNRGLAQRGSKVSFGDFGLKSTDRGRMTSRQIEAARRAMTRHIKRGGKIWIRVFPDKPAVVYGDQRWSYARFGEEVASLVKDRAWVAERRARIDARLKELEASGLGIDSQDLDGFEYLVSLPDSTNSLPAASLVERPLKTVAKKRGRVDH